MTKRKIFTLTFLAATAIFLSACAFFVDSDTSNTASATSRTTELSEQDANSAATASTDGTLSAGNSSSASQTASEYSQPEVSYEPGAVYLSNGIVVAGDRGMEQYGGGVSSAVKYAGYLNAFKAAVGDSVNVYSMPIPIASAFYAPAEYNTSVNNHIKTFAAIRDNLVGVTDINLLNALSAHTEEPIYARTDFHWNALGAYYACQEFTKVAGLPFADLSDFTQDSFSGYVGSLNRYAPALADSPEEFIWYIPSQDYTVRYYDRETFSTIKSTNDSLFFSGNSYSKFIGGDGFCVQIDTGVKNGRKLLYFKESYGNALAPFLISSFEQINIVDIRFFTFDVRDFMEKNGITDVCFALSAFSVVTSSRGESIQQMAN